MTSEPSYTLDKIAELPEGGRRLAIDGPWIAAATDEGVTLWRDLRPERTIESPGAIDRLRFDPGGKELLAAPYALALGVKTWVPLADLGPALVHGLDGPPHGELEVRRADFSADGQALLVYVEHRPPRGRRSDDAGGAAPKARLLWMDRARQVSAVPWVGANFELTSVLVGKHWLVAGGRQLLVWDRQGMTQVATLSPHSLVIRDLALGANERLLASVGNDGKVSVVDTAVWAPVASWVAHDGDAVGVALHPSRPLLATTGQDGQVRVWTLDGKRVATAELGCGGTAIAFSPDGERLVAAGDDRVVVWAFKAR